jgi:hypothetical protein
MISALIADKMSAYVFAGMSAETAAHYARGELEAIYQGGHYSRDTSGAMRLTPPPEALDIETAMEKADAAIAAIINRKFPAPVEKPRGVYQGSAALRHTVAAGIGVKEFFAKSADNDPAAYTADLGKIAAAWSNGQRRFKAFVRGKFLVIDIDRKVGKPDGLEAFYRMFPMETLPAELRGLPGSFPCYTLTPSGGFHLFFKNEGPEVKLRELAPGVEIKEIQITCPGSRREDGEYILYGELNNAPPLYGLIIDAIEGVKRRKEQVKAERTKPRTRAAADRPVQYEKPRITLDDLAHEATAAHAGHHDRQVSFAGRAYRCKFSGAETLTYVKSRTDIFGNGTDTENTVLSVFRDNGGCL